MSSEAAAPEEGRPICLGEALVDLICPDPLDDPADAERFEVHFGGALSNVAVAARRAGAEVALAGATGDDRWGDLLRRRLAEEGVDLRFQAVLEDAPTAFAFATLDRDHEPAFDIHGAGIDAAIMTLRGRERELAAAASAIAFSSNTMVDAGSRQVTRDVCDAAGAAGVPLLFDPNVRPGRWSDRGQARELCLSYARDVTVLKCNLEEARWLTRSAAGSVAELAEALLELGPELTVVTAGAAELAARGACSVEITPPEVELVSPLGAGDVFMGTLAAALLKGGWDLGRAPEALDRPAAGGAEACRHLGAFD